eukprot:scaffold25998_cov122-Cylindrotheca_fusiformis.AAC.6
MGTNHRGEDSPVTLQEEDPSPFAVAVMVDPEGAYPDQETYYDTFRVTNGLDEEIPMQLQLKQGGKCCGSLCDYRRAAIFSAVAQAVSSLIWILAFYMDSRQMVEDGVLNEQVMIMINKANQVHAIINGMTIISSTFAFYGAMKYRAPFVGVNIMWLVLSVCADLIVRIQTTNNVNTFNPAYEYTTSWFALCLAAFVNAVLIYPQVSFIREVNYGILSEHTYPRERYSCCCYTPP